MTDSMEKESVKKLLENNLLASIIDKQQAGDDWMFFCSGMEELKEMGFDATDLASLDELLRKDDLVGNIMGRLVEVHGEAEEDLIVSFGFAPGGYRALQLIDEGFIDPHAYGKDPTRLTNVGMLSVISDRMPITVSEMDHGRSMLTFGEAGDLEVSMVPEDWSTAFLMLWYDPGLMGRVNDIYAGFEDLDDLTYLIERAIEDKDELKNTFARIEANRDGSALLKRDAPQAFPPNLKTVADEARNASEERNDGTQRETRSCNDER